MKDRENEFAEKEEKMNNVVDEIIKKKSAVDNLKTNLHKEIKKMKENAAEYPKKLLQQLDKQKIELTEFKDELEKKERSNLVHERELEIKSRKVQAKEKELKESDKKYKETEDC